MIVDPANPVAWYSSLRTEHPVLYNEELHAWQVFKYDDVKRILDDPATFSSAVPIGDTTFPPPLILRDGTDHEFYRTLVVEAFNPMLKGIAPRIQHLVDEHLARVIPQGQMDIVADLAVPLPASVIADILGVPQEDQERFMVWSNMVSASDTAYTVTTSKEVPDYFHSLFETKRKTPQQDMISAMLKVADAHKVSEWDMIGICFNLLNAGAETTRHLMSWALYLFDESDMEALRRKSSLFPGAIEEVVRCRPPFPTAFRLTTRKVTVRNVTIPAGQLVLASIISANHDELHFTHPEQFDIQRSPNDHLSFGFGIHACFGAPLGRMEARIALQTLLKRAHALRRVDTPVEIMQGLNYGPTSLPITFIPSQLL